MLEENVYWVNDTAGWQFVRGRQEQFHIVDVRAQSYNKNILQVQV